MEALSNPSAGTSEPLLRREGENDGGRGGGCGEGRGQCSLI